MKAFDVPTPEVLIQKPQNVRDQKEKGIRSQYRDQLDMNQPGL
jgi:hypothetical protein